MFKLLKSDFTSSEIHIFQPSDILLGNRKSKLPKGFQIAKLYVQHFLTINRIQSVIIRVKVCQLSGHIKEYTPFKPNANFSPISNSSIISQPCWIGCANSQKFFSCCLLDVFGVAGESLSNSFPATMQLHS